MDAAASSKHDVCCKEDYSLLQAAGVRTVRDALRWHRIEPTEGQYDWSTFLETLEAARETGTEVVWDLCHWGVPDWVDPFSPEFPVQFARFARGAMEVLLEFQQEHEDGSTPMVCAINEISFWSWVGGDEAYFYPLATGRGAELKRHLVGAANAAVRAMRQVCPEVRTLQPEPLIHIAPDAQKPEEAEGAVRHTAAQFEVWDMLLGRQCPELGGGEDLLDVLGVNYYWNNQWVHHGVPMAAGDPRHRPLHTLLLEVWQRYGKRMVLAETSAEGEAGPGWFGYVMAEVREAERLGVPLEAVCLYPVMDYAGWDDDRHCEVGLIELGENMQARRLRESMVAELRTQQRIRAA